MSIGDIVPLAPEHQPFAVDRAFTRLLPIFNELPGIECWIAGGAVRDLIAYGECQTDFDVFFAEHGQLRNAKALVHAITKPSRLSDKTNTGTSKLVLENDFVIKYDTPLGQMDLIKRHFAGPAATVDSFDFTVCAAAFDRQGNFFHHKRFFTDLVGKKLVTHTLSHPLSTLRRLQKYIQKGYTICNGGTLAIAKALKESDFVDNEPFYID